MRDALRTIFSGVVPRAHIVPDRWASGNIIFPATDPVPGPLDLARSPYLIDVLKAWELVLPELNSIDHSGPTVTLN